jgi:hypothetical protein
MNNALMGSSGNDSFRNYALNWIKETSFEVFTTVKDHYDKLYCRR